MQDISLSPRSSVDEPNTTRNCWENEDSDVEITEYEQPWTQPPDLYTTFLRNPVTGDTVYTQDTRPHLSPDNTWVNTDRYQSFLRHTVPNTPPVLPSATMPQHPAPPRRTPQQTPQPQTPTSDPRSPDTSLTEDRQSDMGHRNREALPEQINIRSERHGISISFTPTAHTADKGKMAPHLN